MSDKHRFRVRKQDAQEWNTAGDRVRWLLSRLWPEKPSQMAKDIGMSLTGVLNVTTGKQQPGRQLLDAIVEHTEVNPGWMLSKLGPPFRSTALPVTTEVLPGLPEEHENRWSDEPGPQTDVGVYSPSRYWLRVTSEQPILNSQGLAVNKGDYLLMEADSEGFPSPEGYCDALCGIRLSQDKETRYSLAAVTYTSDEHDQEMWQADTFDLGPEVITEIIVRELPGGELQARRKKVYQETIGSGKHKRVRESTRRVTGRHPFEIELTDVVAVCLLLVRDLRSGLCP